MDDWYLLCCCQESLIDTQEFVSIVGKEGSNETQDVVRPGVRTDSYLWGVKDNLQLELFVPQIIIIHHVGSFEVAVAHGNM